MPAYNFEAEFAEAVENGFKQANGQPVPEEARIKRQTVRTKRKRPTKPGDTIYGYTGMRRKDCRKLGEATVLSVEAVDLSDYTPHCVGTIKVNGRFLSYGERFLFALADGFCDTREFFRFFKDTYGLPLVGVLEVIRW